MPGKQRVVVRRENPGVEVDVTEEIVQMIKDVAALKVSVTRLWQVVLGGMTGGFGLITALIVVL